MLSRPSGRRGRPVLAALAVPLVLAGALAVPAVRQGLADLAGREVAWREVAQLQPQPAAPASVALPVPPAPGLSSSGWGTAVWPPRAAVDDADASQVWRARRVDRMPQAAPGPFAPAPPAPPPAPWRRSSPPGTASAAPAAPLRLGPVQTARADLEPGAAYPLPPGAGVAHVLCPGPRTPHARYWVERTPDGRNLVRRHDGGGLFDFSYRYASDRYVQREPCE